MRTIDIATIRTRHEKADEEQRLAWNFEEEAEGVLNGMTEAMDRLSGDERFDRVASLIEQAHTMAGDIALEAEREVAEATAAFDKLDAELGRIEDAEFILSTHDSDPIRREWAHAVMEGDTRDLFDFMADHSTASASRDGAADMSLPAFIRLRGEEWSMPTQTAEWLADPSMGVLFRDYDCEQNTIENGELLGPCYGIVGESESAEEDANRVLVTRWGTVLE